MKKQSALFCFALCHLALSAQNFSIVNSLNGKEKTFKPGGFYEIVLADEQRAVKLDCCDWENLSGSLTSVTKDSFRLDLKSYKRIIKMDGLDVGNEIYATKKGVNFGQFAKKDVFSFKYFKSEKSRNTKMFFRDVGGICIITGIITATNALNVKGSDSKKSLLSSGGYQVGVGIALLTIGSKKYKLKGQKSTWKFR